MIIDARKTDNKTLREAIAQFLSGLGSKEQTVDQVLNAWGERVPWNYARTYFNQVCKQSGIEIRTRLENNKLMVIKK